MNLEEAIYTYLKTHSGLSSLVGTRIYPLVLPQSINLSDGPAVTFFKVSYVGERVLGGSNPKTVRSRFQFSCWAKTYASAKSVAVQIKSALQDYSGTVGGTGGVKILDANPVDERDIYEQDTGVYHVPVDVTILTQP